MTRLKKLETAPFSFFIVILYTLSFSFILATPLPPTQDADQQFIEYVNAHSLPANVEIWFGKLKAESILPGTQLIDIIRTSALHLHKELGISEAEYGRIIQTSPKNHILLKRLIHHRIKRILVTQFFKGYPRFTDSPEIALELAINYYGLSLNLPANYPLLIQNEKPISTKNKKPSLYTQFLDLAHELESGNTSLFYVANTTQKTTASPTYVRHYVNVPFLPEDVPILNYSVRKLPSEKEIKRYENIVRVLPEEVVETITNQITPHLYEFEDQRSGEIYDSEATRTIIIWDISGSMENDYPYAGDLSRIREGISGCPSCRLGFWQQPNDKVGYEVTSLSSLSDTHLADFTIDLNILTREQKTNAVTRATNRFTIPLIRFSISGEIAVYIRIL